MKMNPGHTCILINESPLRQFEHYSNVPSSGHFAICFLDTVHLLTYTSKTNHYTGCLQMNGAVSNVNKKFIYHLTRAKRTPSAAVTLQFSHALPAVRSLLLTAGLRGQFTRWRRSMKRLSVCSVLRCPDL